MKQKFSIIILLFLSLSVNAQQTFFSKSAVLATIKQNIKPGAFSTTSLDIPSLKNFLQTIPKEFTGKRNTAPILYLPMPEGKMARFHVWKTTIMETGLATQYPEIQTFAGTGIDDKYASLQFELNPYTGFTAQILSVNGNVYISAADKTDLTRYISYDSKARNRELFPLHCNTFIDNINRPDSNQNTEAGQCRGTQLFTYRIALACTGEYATAVCAPNTPTVPATLAAIVTTLNRVNGIYEKELAMRFLLVSNNNLVVYTNSATDPYTNNNEVAMLNENQATLNSVIGTANYDVGLALGMGNANAATLYGVCNFPAKGKAVCSMDNPTGDLFDVGRVAHNIGHLFGALDTHNSNASICNPNGNLGYEPGAGTTIMATAGSCGTDNLQPLPDPYFHSVSFNQITNFITGTGTTGCHGIINTGNTPPRFTNNIIYANTIPMNTPFQLRGVTATDDDGDPVTFSWEGTNRGPVGAWNSAATTSAPAFRSRVPQVNSERIFPDIQLIAAGYPANPPAVQGGLKGETLSSIDREYSFSLTLRDGRGGVMNADNNCSSTTFGIHTVGTVAGTGPFKVNLPNGGENWSASSQQTILWDVAGTTGALINTQSVNILLSIDGGFTYPYFLASGVVNNGFAVVTMPNITASTAKIKIEAVQNVFFDISDANFSISPAPVGFEFGSPFPQLVNCPSPASVQFSLSTISNGSYSTPITLSASNLPAGTSVSFSANPVVPGSSSTITLNNVNTVPQGTYYITISGLSGSMTRSRVLVLNVQTGALPVITVQPLTQSDCEGGTVTFTVTSPSATGYQWQRSIDGGFSFADITPGGNLASLTLTNIAYASENNRRYRCVVIGQCNNAVSNVVQVNVLGLPFINEQPLPMVVCNGSNASTSISVVGSSPSYQWQVNNGSGFVNISGATSRILLLNAVSLSMNGYQYRCMVLNPGCVTPFASNAVLLTVNPLPTVSLSALPYTSLLPGKRTTLTATGTASPGSLPLTYKWYRDAVVLGGVNGNTYTADIQHLGNYRAEVTDAKGCMASSPVLVIKDSVSSRLYIITNPTTSTFSIYYHNPGGGTVKRSISIYNSAGSLLLQNETNVSGAYPVMLYNLSPSSQGLYFVVLRDETGKLIAKEKVIYYR